MVDVLPISLHEFTVVSPPRSTTCASLSVIGRGSGRDTEVWLELTVRRHDDAAIGTVQATVM